MMPKFISELLASPPRAGEGVHNWLFRAARLLHPFMPASEITALLEGNVRNCGRPVSQREIENAVKNSQSCAWKPKSHAVRSSISTSKWPCINHAEREAIIRRKPNGLADLWEMSHIFMGSDIPQTEAIIDRLFPGNPLLCCGKTNSIFDTKPLEDWHGQLSSLALIVPSPMTDIAGITQDGRKSKHTLSNTGTRRFLICEFDSGMTDEQSALLIHLAKYAPLVCVVHSGGKSLHGWFYVQGQPDAKIEKFFRYAVSLGADKTTWTRSQFVRMPDGTRENGNRQTVFYINYRVMEAICE